MDAFGKWLSCKLLEHIDVTLVIIAFDKGNGLMLHGFEIGLDIHGLLITDDDEQELK